MSRNNTVTWVDCKVLTNKCHSLIAEMMEYNKYSTPDESRGRGKLFGDQDVIIAAIELRNRLVAVIDKSSAANKR